MKVLLSFKKEEIYRLYLTFQRNPQNYQKIKERVIGGGANVQFKRETRGRWVFLIAISFVALVSSLYPMAAGDMQSAAAIGAVWLGFMVVFAVWYFFSYQSSYRILRKNESFFQEFEQKAQSCKALEEFQAAWK